MRLPGFRHWMPSRWSLVRQVQLLFVLGMASLASISFFGYQLLEVLLVNGPVHNDIVSSQALIADVLPPPSYLVETMLTAFQSPLDLSPEGVDRTQLRFQKLRWQYEERHRHYRRALVNLPELHRPVCVDADGPAREMFRLIEQDLLPALRVGDERAAKSVIQGPLLDEYKRHREAIDLVVANAKSRRAELEEMAASRISRVQWTVGAASLAAVLCGLLFGITTLKKVRGAVDTMLSVVRAYLRGNLSARAPRTHVAEFDEIGRAFNELADVLDSRTDELSDTISELIEIQKVRDEMSQQLIQSARIAGQSDIASSVLHNVGNVLNSLNIGVSLLRDRLRSLRIGRIKDIDQLLSQYAGRLDEFFTSDPRGLFLPGYISRLADQLLQEYQSCLKELSAVQDHVYHIRNAVASQQSYSKQRGMLGAVSVRRLVDDAFRMLFHPSKQRQMNVSIEIEEMPALITDRHQILQALVNLVRNAVEAMEKMPEEKRSLTIRVHRMDEFVRFEVRDTGIGISAANLPRIFTPRFTSKQNGHGFGLHSCANIVQSLGGRIAVHSEGEGLGATFTFDLPANFADGDAVTLSKALTEETAQETSSGNGDVPSEVAIENPPGLSLRVSSVPPPPQPFDRACQPG